MKMTVEYEDGVWIFVVSSTENEPAYYETFEIEDLEEAEENAAEILRELRSTQDPLAGLFDEET